MDGFMSVYSMPYFNKTTKTPFDFSTYSNLNLWFDAIDPCGNGTVLDNNTTLSGWIDKSKYKNHATAVTNIRPYSSTSMSYQIAGFNSSYPTFDFSGNQGRFQGTLLNSSSITVNTMRVFIVGSIDASSATYARFMGFSNLYDEFDFDNTNRWSFLRNNGGTGMGIYRNNVSLANTTPSGYNIPLIWQAWFDGSKANSKFFNGVSTQEVSSNSTGSFNIQYYAIGQDTKAADDPTGYLNGKISEILVYKGILIDTQVSEIEGYLAWKWGLVSTLPSGHTYKSSPP